MVRSGAKDFLIDGFPRAMDQALAFEQMIKPCRWGYMSRMISTHQSTCRAVLTVLCNQAGLPCVHCVVQTELQVTSVAICAIACAQWDVARDYADGHQLSAHSF
jgi:hypothetical protein